MLLRLEPDSETPIYQQLRDRIVEAIATGALGVDDTLPTTRQLGADLGINMHTVNKAYDQLRREGLVRLGRRTGAVVARGPASGPPGEDTVADWRDRARTLLAEAVAQGLRPDDVIGHCRALLAEFDR